VQGDLPVYKGGISSVFELCFVIEIELIIAETMSLFSQNQVIG
jgi:hypothetical protein